MTDTMDERLSKIGLEKAINKKFGPRTIWRIDEILKPEVYPTPSYTLNDASGIGGIAKGYVHEIYGQTGSGKTTLTLGTIGNAQRMGDECLYLDAENRFDYDRATQIGVDTKRLYVSQTNNCENIFDLIVEVLRTGDIQLVVLDSLATLITDNEFESDMEKSEVGNKAKLIGKGLRKVISCINEVKGKNGKAPTLIMTNQIRNKVGMSYGSPETVPGGEAPKFFSSQRIKLVAKHFFNEAGKDFSMNAMNEEENLIGVRIVHKHIKNSFAPPQKTGSYNIYWDDRVIDTTDEFITLGLQKSVIVQVNKSYYEFEGHKVNGLANMINYFKESPEAVTKLRSILGY